jgi:hypothetical protein
VHQEKFATDMPELPRYNVAGCNVAGKSRLGCGGRVGQTCRWIYLKRNMGLERGVDGLELVQW